jgi:hypothetical protein
MDNTSFNYYIRQNDLPWPAAGFMTKQDADLALRSLRKTWPSSAFWIEDTFGNLL